LCVCFVTYAIFTCFVTRVDAGRGTVKRKILNEEIESDNEDELLSLLNQVSMKKLKFLGNSGGTSGIDSGNEVVHVTQPLSLPASPSQSPRPSSVASLNSASSVLLSRNNNQSSHNGTISNIESGYVSSSSSTGRHSPPGGKNLDSNPDYWQTAKIGIRERNAAMCNNELMADIHFLVSFNGGPSKLYPAHKYVLAVGSSVFYAMFYGTLAETGDEIVVPDVEPEAFLKMLKYLYADEINLDEESVLATLHVAKKYIIPQLARACVQFMEASLTARNACVLLSQARIFDENELMERCWEVIDAQGEIALKSEGFLEIDHATLESILSRETLNCKELHIFNAAISWAAADCERRELDESPGNLRAALGSALQLIRVPTMELKEFADGPAQTGIFSLQESHDLFLHFTATNKPKVEFQIVPRAGLKSQVCHRFQSSAYRSNQWRYRGRCDSIQFSVDRRVFIVGFGLYGSSNGAATYAVHIELKQHGRILASNDTEFFSDGSSSTFHVYFRQPVQIDPETYYTASAILDGMDLSYFGQEGMTDVSVGNVTFQFQCSAESTNGTGVQGGQIPELIFYGPSGSTNNSPN